MCPVCMYDIMYLSEFPLYYRYRVVEYLRLYTSCRYSTTSASSLPTSLRAECYVDEYTGPPLAPGVTHSRDLSQLPPACRISLTGREWSDGWFERLMELVMISDGTC